MYTAGKAAASWNVMPPGQLETCSCGTIECLCVTTELRHRHNGGADADLHVWDDLDHFARNLEPGTDWRPPCPLVISPAGNNIGIVEAYKVDSNEHLARSESTWSGGVPLKHVRSAEVAEEHAAVLGMIDHAARLRPTRRIWQPSSYDGLLSFVPIKPLCQKELARGGRVNVDVTADSSTG
jgi:hypothetical protein